MPYDVGVSQYLQGKGVSNGDIGYDKASGNVTVRNQPFYKPELNMNGTTYSNQNNLDNAYKTYSASQPVIQADGSTGVTANTGQPASNPNPGGQGGQGTPAATTNGGYSNPYTSMIADVMKHLTDTYNAPQQDIYSSPQYAAAKSAQDRGAHQSILAGQESFGQDGMARSSDLARFSQNTQNAANDQLATQLVPQIQAQLAQQKQQEIQNQQSQLNNYMTLGQQADSQHNADRTFDAGRQDAETQATGYFNPSGMTMDQINQEIAKNSSDYANATPQQQHDLHSRNIELNNLLGKTFDPATGTYSGGDGHVGVQTIQSKQIEQALATGEITKEAAAYNLQQLKDPNSPTNLAAKLDLQMKQIDATNYPQEAKLKLDQLKKQIADIGVVHKTPQTADQIEYDKQKVEEIKANILKIQAETNKALVPKPNTPVDSKLSTDNHATITKDLLDPTITEAEANKLVEDNKPNLTDADYKDLKKQLIDKY